MTIKKQKYLGYVTNITTKKRYYFTSLCTVPEKPAIWVDGEIVYNSNPVLAPQNGQDYLHPDNISESDKLKIRKLYVKEFSHT